MTTRAVIRPNRIAGALGAALALAFVVNQWLAIDTQNVNWDEFALLTRAQETIRTRALQGGQRPGLATLMVVPFVENCTDAVRAIVGARRLWLVFTVGYLAGIAALVLAFLPRQPGRRTGAALAVALAALVPVFMRWSLQVRADQPALMFACWGGVLLIASRGRPWRAAAAGVLFALGYVCSQKAIYPAALAGLLFAIGLAPGWRIGAVEWRRGVQAMALCGAAALASLAGYRMIVSLFYDPPAAISLQSTFNLFAYYRATFGYRVYQAMLPTLVPHLLLAVLALVMLVVSGRRTLASRSAIVGCWLTLMLGTVVGWFHAAAFPYFWMTLAIFAGVGLGLGWPSIVEVLGRRVATGTLAVIAVLLAVPAVPAALALNQDSQRVQRDALALIERNFDAAARGFQAEGALVCRRDPDPFPIYFADTVLRRLAGPSREAGALAFIDEFRTRPVAFMIAHRLFAFPEVIERFWQEHYLPYRDEVLVAGREVEGVAGDTFTIDVIVPGRYRWLSADAPAARLVLNGVPIQHRQTVDLSAGVHQFTLLDNVPHGILSLAMTDDPAPSRDPFYDRRIVRDIDPLSRR